MAAKIYTCCGVDPQPRPATATVAGNGTAAAAIPNSLVMSVLRIICLLPPIELSNRAAEGIGAAEMAKALGIGRASVYLALEVSQ
jgi:hypothetical protein